MEERIGRHQEVLSSLQSEIRLAERRVKGLTTMVENLEKAKAEKEAQLSAAESDLKANKGDAVQLAVQVQELEKELQRITRQLADKQGKRQADDGQLADKQGKLQAADRELADLKENRSAIE